MISMSQFFLMVGVFGPVVAGLLGPLGWRPIGAGVGAGLERPEPPPELGSPDLIFPQVAAGGGFVTTFILVNTGNTTAAGKLMVTDQAGSPLTVVLSGSVTSATPGSTFEISLPPGASAHTTASRPGAAGVRVGWARFLSVGGSVSGT